MADLKSYKSTDYDTIDKIAAAKAGIPVELLSGIRLKGERSNADQVSSAGAATVYQIIPSTRKAILDKYGIDAYQNPQSAALASAYILKDSLARNKGDQVQAVGEYIGGTDRKNWGPTTQAYIKRVTGQSPANDFERQFQTALSEASPKPQASSMQKVMQAYLSGKMSKEDAAGFANLIKTGQVLVPETFKLRPEHQIKTLPKGAIEAYNNNEMTPEDAANFEKLAADTNNYQMPTGMQLQRKTTVAEDLGFGKGGLYEPVIDTAKSAYGGLEAGISTLGGGLAGAVGMAGGFARGLAEDIASGNIGTQKAQAANMAEYTAQRFAAPFAPVTEKGKQYVGAIADTLGNPDVAGSLNAIAPLAAESAILQTMAKGAVPQVSTRAAPVLQKAGQVAQNVESGIGRVAAPVGEAVQQAGAKVAGGIKGTAAGAAERMTPSSVSDAADIIKTGEQYGIPVMTSDVVPPKTFIGESVRAAGERVPLVGTGGKRVAQAEARQSAVAQIADEFGVNASDDLTTQIVSDLKQKHSDTINKYAQLKGEVFDRVDSKGALDTTRTVEYLDGEIARLRKLGPSFPQSDIKTLEDFKNSIQGKTIKQVEDLRKVLGDQLASSETTAKSALEKIASQTYGKLKEDMGDFIKANGEPKDFTKWKVANARLSSLIEETKKGGLKRVLEVGNLTPESVNSLIFSKNKSDIQRLYSSLTPAGRTNVQSAIIGRALDKSGGLENISPNRFATELGKLSDQTGVFFNAADKAKLDGFVRVLKATSRAETANLVTPTGLQNYATIGALGLGTVAGYGAAPIAAGIGLVARTLESPAVRNLLVKISKTPAGSRIEQEMIKRAASEINKATNKF